MTLNEYSQGSANDLIVGLQKYVSQSEISYVLASGKTSDSYVDVKSAIVDPNVNWLIINAMSEYFKLRGLSHVCLAAPPLGGALVGAAFTAGSDMCFGTYIFRPDPKTYGLRDYMIGPHPVSPNWGIFLLDDVCSTGRSLLKVADQIQEVQPNWKIVGALAVVDRGFGADEAFQARGISYDCLVSGKELGI